MNNPLVYALVMLLAGIGIPTMATLNGGLGGRLMSSSLATAMALALAFTSVSVYLLATEGFPKKFVAEDLPIYFYLGGSVSLFTLLV